MWIQRAGAQKHYGWTTLVQEGKPHIAWSDEQPEVKVQAQTEPSHRSGSTSLYYWDVHLTLDDVAAILDAVANAGLSGAPADVQRAFESRLPSLIKLLACAAGVTAPTAGESGEKR